MAKALASFFLAVALAVSGASHAQTINLATNVRGNLSINNLNGGVGATTSTFWRGDGTWSNPSLLGFVVGPASATSGDIALFDGATGKLIKDGGAFAIGSLASIGANTVLGNPTAAGAVPAAMAMASCSSASSALIWTTSTGFGCNTSITANTAATATTATNVAVSGITGLGTGVATALATNVGAAGAPVVNGGALGTPSSGTVTNLTGTASININGTVGATTATTGAFTTVTATSIALGGGTALANYAEGTWTPTLNSFTIVNGTGAISTAGYYTRVGRIVHFTVEITGTGTATIASVAGTSYITGLPINNVRGGVATVQNVSMTFTSTGCNVPANNSEIQTPAWSAFTPAVNGVISINGWYETS